MREFTVRDPNGFWVTFGETEPEEAGGALRPEGQRRQGSFTV